MTHISNIIFFAPTSLKTTIIAGVTTGLTGLWNNCTGDWQSFWCECCFYDIMQISLQNIVALLCIHPLNLRVSMKGGKKLRVQIINENDNNEYFLFIYFHDFYCNLQKKRRLLFNIVWISLAHSTLNVNE